MEDKIHPTSDSRVESLFWTDTLVPFEYLSVTLRKRLLEPEKRLMLAVLSDALHRFQRNLFASNENGKEHLQEVEGWFWTKDGDWIFSFENICDEFAMDPDWIRSKLLKWKKKRVATRGKVRILRPRAKSGRNALSRGDGTSGARVSAR